MSGKKFPAGLQRLIENEIFSGALRNGEKYSIESLVERYNVSKEDLNLILPSLLRKGLAAQEDQTSILISGIPQAEIESVFQYAQKSNLKPRTVVRSVEVTQADAFLAETLKVPVRAPVFIQVRTRLVDEMVLANQYNFIPYEICPGLESVDLSQRSFQVTLEEDFHTVITRIEEKYILGNPERDDEKILNVVKDAQILIVQRISYSASDYPLVFADIHVNPKQFHYVENLWPKAVPLVDSLL
jgi:DNA-binding GntR family transcriptional regulator